MSVRMYTSLGDLRRGWIRIFLGCFPSILRLLLAVFVLWLRGLTLTVLTALGWSMFGAGAGAGAAAQGWWLACAITATAGLAAELVMTVRFYRYADTNGALGLLYPAGCCIASEFLLHAVLRRLTGGKVVWKGTKYKAG